MKFAWIFVFLAAFVVADDSSSSSSSSGSSSSSSSSSKSTLGKNLFVDSSSAVYDGYQQAWRYLGWYVKCGSPSDRYNQQHHSHSGDNQDNSGQQASHYCQRFLIWAAYVDENYQGGGIGEYSYYDPFTASWDNSACKAHGNGRCAPMDCHENNSTTWKLMGVFKEASFFWERRIFLSNFFKHEGVCVWNDDNLYSFMSSARQSSWPQGCVSTGVQIRNSYSSDYGNYLYIDMRPTWNGNMTYGLYSDDICKTEYDLPDADVNSIAKNLGLLYGSSLQKWNDGLEAFKVCQPCRAYNLKNAYASSNYYGSYSDSSDPNEGYFQCYDDAGYTNVNQCMKFRTHAQLEVCTWEDLVTATNQGGILQVKVGDTVFGSERMTAEEFLYTVKLKKDANLKEATAEARTVAQYRLEASRVAAMEPTARTWSSFGSTSLALGALSLLGAVFWVGKRRIDQNLEPKKLAEPLLPPDKEFLGNELANTGNISPDHRAIPFGEEAEENDEKADTQEDHSSVSSLSYVSTLPEAVTNRSIIAEVEALDAWYESVQRGDDGSSVGPMEGALIHDETSTVGGVDTKASDHVSNLREADSNRAIEDDGVADEDITDGEGAIAKGAIAEGTITESEIPGAVVDDIESADTDTADFEIADVEAVSVETADVEAAEADIDVEIADGEVAERDIADCNNVCSDGTSPAKNMLRSCLDTSSKESIVHNRETVEAFPDSSPIVTVPSVSVDKASHGKLEVRQHVDGSLKVLLESLEDFSFHNQQKQNQIDVEDECFGKNDADIAMYAIDEELSFVPSPFEDKADDEGADTLLHATDEAMASHLSSIFEHKVRLDVNATSSSVTNEDAKNTLIPFEDDYMAKCVDEMSNPEDVDAPLKVSDDIFSHISDSSVGEANIESTVSRSVERHIGDVSLDVPNEAPIMVDRETHDETIEENVNRTGVESSLETAIESLDIQIPIEDGVEDDVMIETK